jgi:hypothetical protein
MFKNYLKVAVRNLWSNKLYAFINMLGLGVAIGYCVVAYLNHTYNTGFDGFHRNADRIFRVKTLMVRNDREDRLGIVPRPLAPALAADFSAVEKTVRLTTTNAVFKLGDKVFNETVMHADPAFFEMFDFQLKLGNRDVLHDKSRLVLSEETALKYFGNENPLGKQITVRYGDGAPLEFFVGAVAEELPDGSSIQFDALAALEILIDVGSDKENDWADWAHAAFVQFSDPSQASIVEKRLEPYVAAHNAAAPDFQITGLYFDPLPKLGMNAWSEDLNSDILKRAMHPAGMVSPSIIAVLLLLMACFNYINTSIAFSSKRLKEIGIRKVLGASMLHIVNLVNKEFVRLLIAAAAVASVAGYFSVQALLKSIYAYHVGFSLAPFVLGGLSVFIIALLTVGSQVVKVATANPVDSLRYE